MKKVFDLDNNYLAGLIEGNGTFFVPETERCLKTNRILYPSKEISFHKKDLSLVENIINSLNIENTSWLTEADSCFYVKINERTVVCSFEIDQRMTDISGDSCLYFLKEISKILNVNVHETKRGLYTIKASSEKSIEKVKNYFTKYPLKGSKILDWCKIIYLKQNLDKDKIRSIKSQMNSKRPFKVFKYLLS